MVVMTFTRGKRRVLLRAHAVRLLTWSCGQLAALEETGKAEPDVLETHRARRAELDKRCASIAVHYYKWREVTKLPADQIDQPVF